MADTSWLRIGRPIHWRIPLLAMVTLAISSSCATSRTADRGVEPRARWVLADLPSLGAEKVQVLGHPLIQRIDGLITMKFDGREDALVLPTALLEGLKGFTLELLIRPDLDGPDEQRFFHTEDQAGRRVLMELRLDPLTRRWCLDTYLHASAEEHRTLIDRTKTHAAGDWYWVALVYDGTTMTHYVRATKELEGLVRFPPMSTGQTSLGARLNRVAWFKGAIREVRIYDQALAANQLSR